VRGVHGPAAQRTESLGGGSNLGVSPGGEPAHDGRTAAPQSVRQGSGPHGGSCSAPHLLHVRGGRCASGRNGEGHRRSAVGYGSKPLHSDGGDHIGKASSQQGHAAPCTDWRPKPSGVGRERVEVWRMRPEERGGPGHAGRDHSKGVPSAGTPHRGEWALGTGRARRGDTTRDVSPMEVVNGAEGERRRQPYR
jgi:hypothetical protein